ncbi:MAG: Crp/Fnr family transcriptional regulator [marine bacterium B5-7]|nr:MAG: Crp/Fnr family transcriptional regulator [marine bacterium B5-7]
MGNLAKHNSIVKKFSLLLDLSKKEKKMLLSLQDNCQSIPAKTDLVLEGKEFSHTYIIQDGWAYNYKLLEDGRQQNLNFSIRGDFIGLYATVFNKSENSVRALTELTVSKVEPEKIIELFGKAPRLAAAICWTAARDGAILGEHITRIGRRTAYERTGHIILELLRRLEAVDLAESDSYEFPFTQEILADTLGLTTVHMNRTLRALKNDGMVSFNGKRIIVNKRSKLREAVGFNPAYLQHKKLPGKINSL